MRRARRVVAAGLLGLAGCRTPAPPPPLPPGSPPELILPLGDAAPFAVDPASLPRLDAKVASAESVAPAPSAVRAITEELCRREAAARSPLAALIPLGTEPSCPTLGDYLVAADRNRAAAAALDEFYQLADAEGRAAVARSSLPLLDELRAGVAKAKGQGVAVPIDAAELDQRRATLLSALGRAESGAAALDIDLKRRVGVSGRSAGRLRPVGPFPAVVKAAADRDALVQVALETRADLRLIRAAAIRLSPETLPDAEALLEPAEGDPPSVRIARRTLERSDAAEDLDAALPAVRARLAELAARRERRAADEVRAAAADLDSQVAQAALARWRFDAAEGDLATGPDAGPLARLASRLEVERARGELVAAVTSYHRARVKLLAAQGLLGGP